MAMPCPYSKTPNRTRYEPTNRIDAITPGTAGILPALTRSQIKTPNRARYEPTNRIDAITPGTAGIPARPEVGAAHIVI